MKVGVGLGLAVVGGALDVAGADVVAGALLIAGAEVVAGALVAAGAVVVAICAPAPEGPVPFEMTLNPAGCEAVLPK